MLANAVIQNYIIYKQKDREANKKKKKRDSLVESTESKTILPGSGKSEKEKRKTGGGRKRATREREEEKEKKKERG